MPLFLDPKVAILADANKINGEALTQDDLTFSEAKAVSSIVPPPITTRNSAVRVIAKPTAPYTDDQVLFYNRLDFAQVFKDLPMSTYCKLPVFQPKRIHDLIPAFNNYFGTALVPADIEDGPVTVDAQGAGTAVFKAQPGSLGWIGEVTVYIRQGDALLADFLVNRQLSGIEYPSGQSTKGQAEIYSYQYDFSDQATYLSQLVVESEVDVPAALRDLIAAKTGHAWIDNAAGNYSLRGAKLYYNGSNNPVRPKSNELFNHVVEIRLGADCANLAGVLRFHYNYTAPAP